MFVLLTIRSALEWFFRSTLRSPSSFILQLGLVSTSMPLLGPFSWSAASLAWFSTRNFRTIYSLLLYVHSWRICLRPLYSGCRYESFGFARYRIQYASLPPWQELFRLGICVETLRLNVLVKACLPLYTHTLVRLSAGRGAAPESQRWANTHTPLLCACSFQSLATVGNLTVLNRVRYPF